MASTSLSAPIRAQYATSGVVSWSDITAKFISFTFDLLSRIAGAGLNPYTIVVAQVLADGFRLSRQGRQNVQLALGKLTGVQAWSDKLRVGFGVKSLVYNLARTEQGTCVLASCGALIHHLRAGEEDRCPSGFIRERNLKNFQKHTPNLFVSLPFLQITNRTMASAHLAPRPENLTACATTAKSPPPLHTTAVRMPILPPREPPRRPPTDHFNFSPRLDPSRAATRLLQGTLAPGQQRAMAQASSLNLCID